MFPVVASDDFAYKIKPFIMNLILLAVISLGGIGLVSALVLYFASKKFAVTVDPLISEGHVSRRTTLTVWFASSVVQP